MSEYADVIVSVLNEAVNRPFCYAIPSQLESFAKEGMRVLIPFGKGNRRIEGYIIRLRNECGEIKDGIKIKSIERLLDDFPVFTNETLKLAEWMHLKYYTTLADCLHCIMPSGIRIKKTANSTNGKFSTFANNVRFVVLNDDLEGIDLLINEILQIPSKQAEVLSLVLANGQISISDVRAALNISESPIQTLVKKNILLIETLEVKRDLYDLSKFPKQDELVLTSEQQSAIMQIEELRSSNAPKTVLLHGITGSGKTEVYIRIIENAIKEGKQAIVLVPEIALTPQAVKTFMCHFGDKVTVTHSRLSLGERFDQWKKAREGLVSIMIGARSAIFTPFSNLGVIIVDEEHENTYKSEISPKYDAREIAIKRSELTNCLVVLGSATPDVKTYHSAVSNEISLVKLNERVNKKYPKIHIADMRRELADGNRSIFSNMLFSAIDENLNLKQQCILFLNRRGHSTFVSCRRCGYVMECDLCSVNYTYHLYNNKLVCHYCGKEQVPPENCPVCGTTHIRFFGIGTQKIEDEIKISFPNARVLRMDMDTTSRKNSHESIISSFSNGEADILIGTQMIAKGLNFPNVSLVGIVAADTALNNGDFRSAETAYQLITQVSGRAGRALLDGNVYIQTYEPEHYSIQFAATGNYDEFYNHEIILRKQMHYPPFSHFFVLLFTGTDEKKIIQSLHKLLDLMKYFNRKKFFDMLGPSPATVSKIRLNYRWKLIVKGDEEENLKLFVFYCLNKLRKKEDLSGINMNLTLDPYIIV